MAIMHSNFMDNFDKDYNINWALFIIMDSHMHTLVVVIMDTCHTCSFMLDNKFK